MGLLEVGFETPIFPIALKVKVLRFESDIRGIYV